MGFWTLSIFRCSSSVGGKTPTLLGLLEREDKVQKPSNAYSNECFGSIKLLEFLECLTEVRLMGGCRTELNKSMKCHV
jgi:hypothetical protein